MTLLKAIHRNSELDELIDFLESRTGRPSLDIRFCNEVEAKKAETLGWLGLDETALYDEIFYGLKAKYDQIASTIFYSENSINDPIEPLLRLMGFPRRIVKLNPKIIGLTKIDSTIEMFEQLIKIKYQKNGNLKKTYISKLNKINISDLEYSSPTITSQKFESQNLFVACVELGAIVKGQAYLESTEPSKKLYVLLFEILAMINTCLASYVVDASTNNQSKVKHLVNMLKNNGQISHGELEDFDITYLDIAKILLKNHNTPEFGHFENDVYAYLNRIFPLESHTTMFNDFIFHNDQLISTHILDLAYCSAFDQKQSISTYYATQSLKRKLIYKYYALNPKIIESMIDL